MTRDEFDNLLRLWGYHFGPRRTELEAGVGLYGNSTLAGLGRPSTICQVATMDRGGLARRRMLGYAAGMVDDEGVARVLPSWAVEPVRATETRTSAAKILAPDFSIPAEAQRVERAVRRLHDVDAALARIVRTQFCMFGAPREKAETVGLRLGVYRERLSEAKGWLRREVTAA